MPPKMAFVAAKMTRNTSSSKSKNYFFRMLVMLRYLGLRLYQPTMLSGQMTWASPEKITPQELEWQSAVIDFNCCRELLITT